MPVAYPDHDPSILSWTIRIPYYRVSTVSTVLSTEQYRLWCKAQSHVIGKGSA